MTHWKASDLKNLKNNHDPDVRKKIKMPKIEKVSTEKRAIEMVLFVLHREGKIPEYVKELQFHEKRKWRFDWAIPELHTAIEYDGLISEKSRHTTISGYTGDCEKFNASTILGWKVLRYTALNYKNLYNDLVNILKTNK